MSRKTSPARVEAFFRALGETGNQAEMPDYLPDLPMPRMNFDEAIQLLRLHQARVHGSGNRPGRLAQLPPSDEVFARLAKDLDRVERSIARKDIERTADQRAVARGVRGVAGKRPGAG